MLVLDVNVLVAAHRDDHPQHDTVRPWFDEALAVEHGASVATLDRDFARFASVRHLAPGS